MKTESSGRDSSFVFERQQAEKEIQRQFEIVTTSNPEFSNLVQGLLATAPVVIFGGFVRDGIHNVMHAEKHVSRDIDLVVCGKLGESQVTTEKNNFGGRRAQLSGGFKADYWELENTYAFKEGFFAATLECLPLTTVFTLNACFYNISERRLVEHHAIQDIASRTIAFNCREYLQVFPEYQAFRAMDLAHRLRYRLHTNVQSFVTEQIRKSTSSSFAAAVQKHRPELTQEAIAELCARYAG